jgi:hypothetical protein
MTPVLTAFDGWAWDIDDFFTENSLVPNLAALSSAALFQLLRCGSLPKVMIIDRDRGSDICILSAALPPIHENV